MALENVNQVPDITDREDLKELDISDLDESEVVYLKIPVSKKQLALKSPVFERQFCGLMRKISGDVNYENLNMDDFSAEACTAFLSYMYTGNIYCVNQAKDCELTLELYRLADKYQMADLMVDLRQAVDNLEIQETDVFTVVDAVLNNIAFAPIEDICHKILRKCAEVLAYKRIDLFKLWLKHGNENGPALVKLNEELEKSVLSRSETTFCFQIDNFSKVKDDRKPVFSPPFVAQNMVLRIEFKKFDKSLGCFVTFDKDIKQDWKCYMHSDIRMLNQKDGTKYSKQFGYTYSKKQYSWGGPCFIEFKDLFDPENCYVKDDTALFEIKVKAEIPQGIGWDTKKLGEDEFCVNCLANPCMHGLSVREAWEGLQVSRKFGSRDVIKRVSSKNEGQCTISLHGKYDPYYVEVQQMSVQPTDVTLLYRCK